MKKKEETPEEKPVEKPKEEPKEEEVSEEKVDEVVNKIFEKLESKMEEKAVKEAKIKADKIKVEMLNPSPIFISGTPSILSKAAGIYIPVSQDEIRVKDKKGKEIVLGGEKLHREAELIRAFTVGNTAFIAEYMAKALNEGTAALGGSLVSTEFSNILVIARDSFGQGRNAGFKVININKDTYTVRSADGMPKATWGSENATKTTTSASFGEQNLTPYKMFCLLYSSDELIADSDFDLINYIRGAFGKAMAEAEDAAFAAGSGTGQPTGLSTYTFGGFAGSLTYGNLWNLIFRLGIGYRKNAKWFMNKTLLARVFGMTDTNGQPIIHPDPQAPASYRLLGYPIVEYDNLPATAIYFGDPTSYWIADRQGIRFETNRYSETAWTQDKTSFRAVERVDAELVDTHGIVAITGIG